MDPRLRQLCEGLAVAIGRKARISSGVRMPEQNAAAGGVQDSAHLPKANAGGLTVAVDVAISNGWERMAAVRFLASKGVSRVGVYDKHIHFDLDASLPQNVLWVGVSK